MNIHLVRQHAINSSVATESRCSSTIYTDQTALGGFSPRWPDTFSGSSGARHKLCCFPKN